MKKIETMDELLQTMQKIKNADSSTVRKPSSDDIYSLSSAIYSLIAEKKKEKDVFKSFSCIMAQSFRNPEINDLLAKLLKESSKEEAELTRLLDVINNFQ